MKLKLKQNGNWEIWKEKKERKFCVRSLLILLQTLCDLLSSSSAFCVCFCPFVCLFFRFSIPIPIRIWAQRQRQQQNRRSSNFMGPIFVEKYFISQTNNSLSLSLHFHLTWQNVRLKKMFRARAKVQVLLVSFLCILCVLSEQKTCTLQVKQI